MENRNRTQGNDLFINFTGIVRECAEVVAQQDDVQFKTSAGKELTHRARIHCGYIAGALDEMRYAGLSHRLVDECKVLSSDTPQSWAVRVLDALKDAEEAYASKKKAA